MLKHAAGVFSKKILQGVLVSIINETKDCFCDVLSENGGIKQKKRIAKQENP